MIPAPKTLYKYRDTCNENHIQSLKEKYIFIPSPIEFNDPFDCKMPMDFESVADDIYLQRLFAQKIAILAKTPQSKFEELVEKILSSGKLRNKDFLLKMEQIQIEEMSKDLGVFCLSKESNNLLLWSHYANSHKGFCVGYNPIEIHKALGYPTMGPVNYCNVYPLVSSVENPEKTSYIQVFHKSIDWYYEKEYRYIKYNFANKKISIPKEAIKEIYLGSMISEDDRRLIEEIRNNTYPDAHLYRYSKSKYRFEMEIENIN
jgi:hypothetical protein